MGEELVLPKPQVPPGAVHVVREGRLRGGRLGDGVFREALGGVGLEAVREKEVEPPEGLAMGQVLKAWGVPDAHGACRTSLEIPGPEEAHLPLSSHGHQGGQGRLLASRAGAQDEPQEG